MENKVINVLGQDYELLYVEDNNEKLAKANANGQTEAYSKKILVRQIKETGNTCEKLEDFTNKIVRHEMIHAFLFEAGQVEYFDDEKLVDTLAYLIPKMAKCMKEADVL